MRLKIPGVLALLALLTVLFNACANNNSTPSAPVTVVQPVTILATATFTPTGSITPTPSPTLNPTPVYYGNYGTTAAPNGFNFNPGTLTLTIAEGEISGTKTISATEGWNVLPAGSLSTQFLYNFAIVGVPTPAATPAWQGTTLVLTLPRAVAVSGNYTALLDNQLNGGATLWMGDQGTWSYPNYGFAGPYESSTSGYGGVAFKNPMALAADSSGNFYVADAGNGYIEMFGFGSPNLIGLHRWNGLTGVNYIKPNAVACDSNNNVWVGDSGTSPSRLQAWTSGGTTCLGSWNLIPGCVINGLAVYTTGGPTYTVYVSDTGNGGKVEVYLVQPPSTCNLYRMWGDPNGSHESHPWAPSCIVYDSIENEILVGDTGNDLIQIFRP